MPAGLSDCRPAGGGPPGRAFRVRVKRLMRSSFARWGRLLLLAGMACGCRPAAPPTATAPAALPWFQDVTAEAGLNFVHDPGLSGTYFLPACMGSGAALFDF